MRKSISNDFVQATTPELPTLKDVGEVIGTGLGKMANVMETFLPGLLEIVMGRESAAMRIIASATKTPTHVLERMPGKPAATRELEMPLDGEVAKPNKSKAKNGFARVASGVAKGYKNERAKGPKDEIKRRPPASTFVLT
jgi:hypothetical protein